MTISETHLDPQTEYEFLNLEGFHSIIRKDRCRGGGGVAVYVRECIAYKRRIDLEDNNLESIWLQLNTLEGKVLLCTCYRPPVYNDFWSILDQNLDVVKEDPTKYVFITGDLNADLTTAQGKKLTRLCNNHSLVIHNHESTRITETTSTVLDQFLSNVPSFVRSTFVTPPLSSNDHCTLSVILNFKIKREPAYERLVWIFKNANFDEFRERLSNAPWDECFEQDDVDIANQRWTELFLNIARTCVPNRVVTVRPRDVPWFSSSLRKLRRKLFRAYRSAKILPSNYRWAKYRNLRAKYEADLEKAEKVYNNNLTQSLTVEKNSRKWWATVKHMLGKGGDSSYPPLEHNNKFITDNGEKAKLFNEFFISHSNIETKHASLPEFRYLTDHRLNEIIVSEDEVLDLIKAIDVNKATGHDGIGPRLLKEAGRSIVSPLTRLINMSLRLSVVPREWKKAQIIPLHKKGEKSDLNNYRPISILPTISKIAEKVVFKHVYNYFHMNSLITRHQSGFKPGDGTVNQLAYLYNLFSDALDKKRI